MNPVALLMALSLAAPSPGDTVVSLRRGDRVVLENLTGKIVVGGWDRDELELRSEDQGMALIVSRSGSTVRLMHADRKGRRRGVESSVRLPRWVDVSIGGPSLDISVTGVDGRIDVNNVEGDVRVENVGGPVMIRSVEGEIEVIGVRGGVDVSSQSEDVTLRDIRGPISAHTGSGDLELTGIRSESVRAETQDGDINFSGEIADGGDYRFFTHDGDALIAIPRDSDARVSVSTFDGEFESEFPVLLDRFTGGREFDFTIGAGSARIEIQVFDGEIRLMERN